MKKSEKQLGLKANFSTFLPFNCSNFRLKQCERHQSYQNSKVVKFEGVCGELESKKKKFRETITYKIFETKSRFHVK